MATKTDLELLEAMIDRISLSETLAAIAEVCRDKAEHLRSNWQDEASARTWDRSAKAVNKLAASS